MNRSSPSVLISHPTGNQNVRHSLNALHSIGALNQFWTTFAWNPGTAADRFIPARLSAELRRRSYPGIPAHLIRTKRAREGFRLFGRFLEAKIPVPRFLTSIDDVYLALDRCVSKALALGGLDTVYAYEDGACQSFYAAKQHGIRCVYELPIGYWKLYQKILEDERMLNPGWFPIMGGVSEPAWKLERKDQEIEFSDAIVVASTFTKRSLSLANTSCPIEVLPYGSPACLPELPRRAKGPLRVLFVGALSQRKGIGYLARAIEMMGIKCELTLVGRAPRTIPMLVDFVRKHRWLDSISHAQVLAEMERHDVLLFPSLFEGFGLVVLEAMSRGLVVITTPHTCGPDVLDDGVDGFIVPIRSAEGIAEKLTTLSDDLNQLRSMGEAALAKARSRSWGTYESQFIRVISQR